MSNRPNPVALTAAMLMRRAWSLTTPDGPARDPFTEHDCASLASDLRRLAPACVRLAVAQCNGEWRDGQRLALMKYAHGCAAGMVNPLDELDAEIEAYAVRLDKRIAKMNAKLAPLALEASNAGDPRGCVLKLTSTDKSRPLPRNGWDDASWGIA